MFIGCKTPEAAGDNLAGVKVHGHSVLEVARAVSESFQGAGFAPVPLPETPMGENRMMFDKRGSTTDSAIWGDWSSGVYWRAKIKLEPQTADTVLVTCNAYRVLEKGSKHFEEEHKLTSMKRAPYQKLLENARDSLNPPAK